MHETAIIITEKETQKVIVFDHKTVQQELVSLTKRMAEIKAIIGKESE